MQTPLTQTLALLKAWDLPESIFNISSTIYGERIEVTVSLYQSEFNERTKEADRPWLKRQIKRAFGPLQDLGSDGFKYLGSEMFLDTEKTCPLRFHWNGVVECRVVEEVETVIELDEHAKERKRQRIEDLKKSILLEEEAIERGTVTETRPVYDCTVKS